MKISSLLQPKEDSLSEEQLKRKHLGWAKAGFAGSLLALVAFFSGSINNHVYYYGVSRNQPPAPIAINADLTEKVDYLEQQVQFLQNNINYREVNVRIGKIAGTSLVLGLLGTWFSYRKAEKYRDLREKVKSKV